MQRLIVILTLGLFVFLSGCASMAGYMPFSKTDDPAARQPFADIEVPKGMSKVSGGYEIPGPDGQTNGLALYEGYVSSMNLQYDMDRLMREHGWTLVSGGGSQNRVVGIYKKDKLYSVFTVRALTAGTALDVWLLSSLKKGAPFPLLYAPAPEKSSGSSSNGGEGITEGGGTVNTAPSSGSSVRHDSGLEEKEL